MEPMQFSFLIWLGKVDPVLAVGIWVGFGPELGSEKNRPKINKSEFLCILSAKSTLINKDLSLGYPTLYSTLY